MHPIRLTLPVRPDLALEVWNVLELGLEARVNRRFGSYRNGTRHAQSAGYNEHQRAADRVDHLRVLATALRDHMSGDLRCPSGLWLERRELAELLRLLECGLSLLGHRYSGTENAQHLLRAVSELLSRVREQLGIRRKPVQGLAAPRERAASAVAT